MYLAIYTVKRHWNFTSIFLTVYRIFLAIKNLGGAYLAENVLLLICW